MTSHSYLIPVQNTHVRSRIVMSAGMLFGDKMQVAPILQVVVSCDGMWKFQNDNPAGKLFMPVTSWLRGEMISHFTFRI